MLWKRGYSAFPNPFMCHYSGIVCWCMTPMFYPREFSMVQTHSGIYYLY